MQYEFVSFEDCWNVAAGSEDEVIDRIDAKRAEAKGFETDAKAGSDSLIEAVHAARRYFR
ncbi:MAG: hypothetical protein JW384_00518 [Nitrosomonadaceae bacterium]|nr:hypothetical protein [Nitrosomonadaceae bacterium]